MKKLIIESLLSTSLLFGYELNFNKEFSSKIKSDILATHITISVNNKKESFVNSKIEDFQELFKYDTSITKKNGNYSITPRYYYKNGKSYFKEYEGRLTYKLESKNSEKLNEFITDIYNLKDRVQYDSVKLSISNIHWEVSKEKFEESLDNLRMVSINWIENYSKNLNKNCQIKKISLNKNGGHITPYARAMVAMDSSGKNFNVTPNSDDKTIKLNANYLLECR
jgi:predicted secreted protein